MFSTFNLVRKFLRCNHSIKIRQHHFLIVLFTFYNLNTLLC